VADYAGVPASMLGSFFDNMMRNVEAQAQQPLWMQLGDVGMYEAVRDGRVSVDDFVLWVNRRHKEKTEAAAGIEQVRRQVNRGELRD
jgi:hypothetical protein